MEKREKMDERNNTYSEVTKELPRKFSAIPAALFFDISKHRPFFWISFVKKNGEERILKGSLYEEGHLRVSMENNPPPQEAIHDFARIFDLEKNAWRTVRFDSIKLMFFFKTAEEALNFTSSESRELDFLPEDEEK